MGSRERREAWAEFLRRRAAVERDRIAGWARRHWTPVVRRRARAAGWIGITLFGVWWVVCSATAVGYSWRAHHLAGIPFKHYADRRDGQPGYRPSGRPTADRPRVPITEDEFRAWEENTAESDCWGRRAAASLPAAALVVLLIGRLTGAWPRTGPGPPKNRPSRTAGHPKDSQAQSPGPAVG